MCNCDAHPVQQQASAAHTLAGHGLMHRSCKRCTQALSGIASEQAYLGLSQIATAQPRQLCNTDVSRKVTCSLDMNEVELKWQQG